MRMFTMFWSQTVLFRFAHIDFKGIACGWWLGACLAAALLVWILSRQNELDHWQENKQEGKQSKLTNHPFRHSSTPPFIQHINLVNGNNWTSSSTLPSWHKVTIWNCLAQFAQTLLWNVIYTLRLFSLSQKAENCCCFRILLVFAT